MQILDAENVPVKQIVPYLAILSKKSENDIANVVKKSHNFIRNTKSYLKKKSNPIFKVIFHLTITMGVFLYMIILGLGEMSVLINDFNLSQTKILLVSIILISWRTYSHVVVGWKEVELVELKEKKKILEKKIL